MERHEAKQMLLHLVNTGMNFNIYEHFAVMPLFIHVIHEFIDFVTEWTDKM